MVDARLEEALRQPRLALLVGAGISCPPPSSLMSGAAFTTRLIDALAPSEDIREELHWCCWGEDPDRESVGDFLRFEGVMQTLTQTCDPELHVLDHLESSETPNSNHYTLAGLLGRGHAVFTVNFDSLIERACLELAIPYETAATDEEFQTTAPITLCKLHGSLKKRRDDAWIDTRESIRATLRCVGKGDRPLGLEPAKRDALSRALVECDLVVMGYSGYDDFDICPLLSSIHSERKIIWINHSSDEHCRRWSDLARSDRDAGGALVRRHDAHLYDMGARGTRARESILLYDADTAEVMRVLRDAHGIPQPATRVAPAPDWDGFFRTWQQRYAADEGVRYATCGLLFFSLSRYELSMAAMCQAQRLFRKAGDEVGEAKAGHELGMLHYVRGENREALACLTESAAAAERQGGFEGAAKSLLHIGLVHERMGEREQALSGFLRALTYTAAVGDDLTRAQICNAIGKLKMGASEYLDAVDWFEKAHTCFTRTGDLTSAAAALHNLGVARAELGDRAEAFTSFARSNELHDLLGNKLGRADNLHELGLLYQAIRQADQALRCHMKARRLREECEDERGVSRSLLEIGRVHLMHGSLASAKEAFDKCMRLVSKLDDKEGMAALMHHAGAIHERHGRHAQARTAYGKSMNMYRELEHVSGTARNLHALGLLECGRGEVASGRSYLVEALALFEQIGELESVAKTYVLLGKLCVEDGGIAEAARLLCRACILFAHVGTPVLEQALEELGAVRKKVGTHAFLALLSDEVETCSKAYGRDLGEAAFRICWLLGIELQTQGKGDVVNQGGSAGRANEAYDPRLSLVEMAELHGVGKQCLHNRRFEEARTVFSRVVELGGSRADPGLLAEAYSGLGMCCFEAGEYDEARRYYTEGIGLLTRGKTSRPVELGKLLANLSNVYAYGAERNLALAEEKLNEALPHFLEAGDDELAGATHASLGSVQAMQRQTAKALVSFESACRFYEAAGLDAMVERTQASIRKLRVALGRGA